MRNSGQGSICDCCKTTIEPFDTHRLIFRDLVKGKHYDKVSSDTTSVERVGYHFCDDCMFKIKSMLENVCNGKE